MFPNSKDLDFSQLAPLQLGSSFTMYGTAGHGKATVRLQVHIRLTRPC